METQFGCQRCYGEDPGAVQEYYRSGGLKNRQNVVDDPHFIVSVRQCRECGQRFVWIFTEFIDWENGDDPSYRDIVPVTDAEAAAVLEQGEQVDTSYLGSLGEGRRRLSRDWPSGESPRLAWRQGAFSVVEGH